MLSKLGVRDFFVFVGDFKWIILYGGYCLIRDDKWLFYEGGINILLSSDR